MLHPNGQIVLADNFIDAVKENLSITTFDNLMINQQYSQLNILRKISTDKDLTPETCKLVHDVIDIRLNYLTESLKSLQLKSVDPEVLMSQFKLYNQGMSQK